MEVNPPKDSPVIPLISAIKIGHYDIVEILLKHQANPNGKLLGQPSALSLIFKNHKREGGESTSCLLIKSGADPNTLIGHNNETALIVASALNWIETVATLLSHNADIEASSSNGTALCVAAAAGHIEIVEMLLDAGADVEALKPEPRIGTYATPVCLAARAGHAEVVSTLANHGANIHYVMGDRKSPIVLAIEEKHSEVAEMLRIRGAKI